MLSLRNRKVPFLVAALLARVAGIEVALASRATDVLLVFGHLDARGDYLMRF